MPYSHDLVATVIRAKAALAFPGDKPRMAYNNADKEKVLMPLAANMKSCPYLRVEQHKNYQKEPFLEVRVTLGAKQVGDPKFTLKFDETGTLHLDCYRLSYLREAVLFKVGSAAEFVHFAELLRAAASGEDARYDKLDREALKRDK
jgi:hypothetical protein